MTPDQAAAILKQIATSLRVVGEWSGNAGLVTAADALDALASDPAKIAAVFSTVQTATDLIHKLIDWLHGNGHSVAASYLVAGAFDK